MCDRRQTIPKRAQERDMCEEPAAANAFSLYLHRAAVTGLHPGSSYRYSIAGGAAGRFAAAPEVGARLRRGVRFAAFGDMGSSHPGAKSPG